jgi:hypothetical protein
MTHEQFTRHLEARLAKTREVLAQKATEYSTDDRMHNFHQAAAFQGITRHQALMGMLAKHLVSVQDLVRATAAGKLPTVERVEEKIGDSINYLILLEAMFYEDTSLESLAASLNGLN